MLGQDCFWVFFFLSHSGWLDQTTQGEGEPGNVYRANSSLGSLKDPEVSWGGEELGWFCSQTREREQRGESMRMKLGEKQLEWRGGRTKVFVLVCLPQKPGLLSSTGGCPPSCPDKYRWYIKYRR